MAKNSKKNKKKKNNTNRQASIQKKEQLERERIIREEKRNRLINIGIFVVYAAILIVVAFHHELWRDEAQSWLIAKNLNFIKIIGQLKYEAHPFLWYYLLRVFSIFGLKYDYITVIPVLLNLIATYILLNKSKFNKITNIIIMFSSCFFFYCGVLTRSYSLAYLLVVILSFIYKDRYKKPLWYGLLLFAIMNTHILLLGFIGGLILVDIYEFIKNKENRKSIFISMSMFVLGLVMYVIQFLKTVSSTGKGIHFEYLLNIFDQTKQLFYSSVNADVFYVVTILAIITYVVYLVCKKEYRNLVILLCGILFQILFATMVYNSVNASSLIYLNILFALIQSDKIDNFITTITIVIFISTFYGTYLLISNDYKYMFSDASNVAKYIEKNVDKGSKIYCELLDFCASVNAHLPSKKYHFIDYNTNKEYTYTEYGDYYKILYDQTLYKSYNFLDKKKMDYFIGSINNKEVLEDRNSDGNYELVYETRRKVYFSGEGYVIYKHK